MDPYAHPSPSPNQPRQPNGYTSSPQPSYPRSPTGSSPVNRRALPTPPSTAASASPMSSPPPLDNPNPSAAGPTPGVAGVNNYKTHKQGAPSNSSFTTALDNLAHFNPTFSVGNLGLGLGVGIPNGNGDRNGSGNVNGEEEVLGGGENVIPEMWTSSAPPISNPVVSTPAPPNPTPIPVNGDAHSQPISSPEPGLLNPSPNHGGASSTPPRKSLDAPLSPSQQQQSIPSTPSSPSARSPRSPAPPTSFPAYLSTELTPLHSSTPTPNAVMGGMNLSNRALEAGTPGPSAAGAGAPGGTGGVKGAVRKRTVSGESKKSGVIVAGQEGEGGGGEELLRKASLYYSTSVAAAQMRSLSPEPSSIPVPIQERAGGGGMPNSQSAPNMRTSISTPARARDRREEQQQQQQPRRPPQPVQQEEVCIECMMRDQDMIDVDVTSPGIWARASDADFEEALRTEEEEEIRTNDERGGRSRENFEGSSVAHSRDGLAGASASASNLHGSGSGSKEGGRKRKKIGRGQRLTTPALRLWTNMVRLRFFRFCRGMGE
ncbi:hypothetical protein BT69DRAFT_1240631 [Atractiella rhizophila]|nr:hypothetical protein BT69DRAFT_1240631 [Atractiella rhizophila]